MDEDKKQRQKYTNRIFFLGLEIIFYFGIPAVLGVWIGNMVDKKYNLNINIPILFATYIISWIIVFLRYKSIKKSFKK